MSIITTIDGIPLFDTALQASKWGNQFGLHHYHTHSYNGQVGYMAGSNHSKTIASVKGGVVPTAIQEVYSPQTQTTPSPTTRRVQPRIRTGGTSGGTYTGGGGGY